MGVNRLLNIADLHFEVRGEIDDRDIEQIVRCAEEGDALGTALCADGHVGYSQPIGGVVAYRNHISPSLYPLGIAMASTDIYDPFKD